MIPGIPHGQGILSVFLTLLFFYGVGRPKIQSILKPLAILLFAFGCIAFVKCSTQFSAQKPFWEDERVGITDSALGHSVGHLVIHGAEEQGSPSPLYYLSLKGVALFRPWLAKGAIREVVYWRWTAMLPILLAACILFIGRADDLNPLLASIASILFLFSYNPFYYASEARPYALWVCAAVFLLMGIFHGYEGDFWPWAFPLLGFSVTTSIFQITTAAMALAYVQWKWPGYLKQPLCVATWVGAGFLIAGYYCLFASHWGYGTPSWGLFFTFMLDYKYSILATLTLAAVGIYDEEPSTTALGATLFLWFAMGPLIFWVSRRHGLFFTERHYIYWTVATLFAAMGLTRWVATRLTDLRKLFRPDYLWAVFLIVHCVRRLDLFNLDQIRHIF